MREKWAKPEKELESLSSFCGHWGVGGTEAKGKTQKGWGDKEVAGMTDASTWQSVSRKT